MPPRTVTVDGATFQIDQELTATRTGAPTITDTELRWQFVFGVPTTKGLEFHSAPMEFSAAVTLLPGAAAGVWQAGFAQNVTTLQATATYASGATITYRLEHGPAMRDGEPEELPFSYKRTPLTPGDRTDLSDSDDPKLWLPEEVDSSPLDSVNGVFELVTWLSLARAAAPRKTVLLGRVTWRVNWAVTRGAAGYEYVTPAEVPHVVDAADNTLAQELTAATLPAPPDYRLAPDYRGVSGNDYRVCRLTRPGQPDQEWAFTDEDEAKQANVKTPDPRTWLHDQGQGRRLQIGQQRAGPRAQP